jgi:hypothetical protein
LTPQNGRYGQRQATHHDSATGKHFPLPSSSIACRQVTLHYVLSNIPLLFPPATTAGSSCWPTLQISAWERKTRRIRQL